MARNKRKNIKDKSKFKALRSAAKKRWRNKRAEAKRLKHAVEQAVEHAAVSPESEKSSIAVGENEEPNPAAALIQPVEPLISRPQGQPEQGRVRMDGAAVPEKFANVKADGERIKQINPTEIVRANKFLGSGTFGTCHLAHYRGIVVAVKEFKSRRSRPDKEVKGDVLHEARMISYLGDHRGLPLLFGVVTKSTPFCLVTQFHGDKTQSLTLYKAMKRLKLDKPHWLCILRGAIEALSHDHSKDILHNDLKSNNILLEKRGEDFNPVIIDFGKARFISNPKARMSLSASAQEQYRHSYPHIAPEIVRGEGRQSVQSDVFSVGRIALAILNLLPTATALSLKAAKQAILDNPAKRPSLEELLLHC